MTHLLKIKYYVYFFYYLLYIKNGSLRDYHEREREREKSRVYLAIAKEGRRSVEKRWETLGQSIVIRLGRGKSEHLRGQTYVGRGSIGNNEWNPRHLVSRSGIRSDPFREISSTSVPPAYYAFCKSCREAASLLSLNRVSRVDLFLFFLVQWKIFRIFKIKLKCKF